MAEKKNGILQSSRRKSRSINASDVRNSTNFEGNNNDVYCIGCEQAPEINGVKPSKLPQNAIRVRVGDLFTKFSRRPMAIFLSEIFHEDVSEDCYLCLRCYEFAASKDLALINNADMNIEINLCDHTPCIKRRRDCFQNSITSQLNKLVIKKKFQNKRGHFQKDGAVSKASTVGFKSKYKGDAIKKKYFTSKFGSLATRKRIPSYYRTKAKFRLQQRFISAKKFKPDENDADAEIVLKQESDELPVETHIYDNTDKSSFSDSQERKFVDMTPASIQVINSADSEEIFPGKIVIEQSNEPDEICKTSISEHSENISTNEEVVFLEKVNSNVGFTSKTIRVESTESSVDFAEFGASETVRESFAALARDPLHGNRLSSKNANVEFGTVVDPLNPSVTNLTKISKVFCDSCSYVGATSRSVETHLRNVHKRASQYTCDKCGQTFVMKLSLDLHVNGRHGNKRSFLAVSAQKFTCDHCKARFTSKKALREHTIKEHQSSKIKCPLCPVYVRSTQSLIRHDALYHQCRNVVAHSCTVCGKQFHDPLNLEEHCVTEHSLSLDKFCSKCGLSFATSDMLKKHEKMHMAYYCHRCETGFKKENTFKTHLETYHGRDGSARISGVMYDPSVAINSQHSAASDDKSNNVFENKGDEAPKAFDRKIADECLASIRGKPYNEKIVCVFCSKSVTCGHLKSHFLKHSGEFPHSCPFCDKKSIQSTNLRKHVRNRHPDKFSVFVQASAGKKNIMKCKFCSLVSHDVDTMEQHLWQHMFTKPIDCTICHMKFGMDETYKEHRRKHYFSSQVVCEHCKRSFRSIGYFHEHYEKCSTNWKCDQCNELYWSESSYRKHKRAYHSGVERKYACPFPGCLRVFFEKHRFDDHQITHDEAKNFQCYVCSRTFKRKRPLDEHMMNKHATALTLCLTCSKPIKHYELVEHRKDKHLSEMHICQACQLPFWTKESLFNHYIVHHSFEQVTMLHYCEMCQEIVIGEANYKLHLSSHSSSSRFCTVFQCSVSCNSSESLRQHLLCYHKLIVYKCTYCQTDFQDEHSLTEHISSVHLQSYVCAHCHHKYYSYESFQQHTATHDQIQKFQCGICSVFFSDIIFFCTHVQRSHSDSIDFKDFSKWAVMEVFKVCCVEGCEFSTSFEGDIKTHLLSHGLHRIEPMHFVQERKIKSYFENNLELHNDVTDIEYVWDSEHPSVVENFEVITIGSEHALLLPNVDCYISTETSDGTSPAYLDKSVLIAEVSSKGETCSELAKTFANSETPVEHSEVLNSKAAAANTPQFVFNGSTLESVLVDTILTSL